jgi:thymidylate synthase (FAD)
MRMEAITGGEWKPDRASDGELLAEFAGRACYQSWTKPNPATSSNAGYLRHILDVGHSSVLEHGTATFCFTGITRSLTHELIRHRHFSYSQLSQRYVNSADAAMVVPPDLEDDPVAQSAFAQATDAALNAYDALCARLEDRYAGQPFGGHRQHEGIGDLVTCAACGTVWPCTPVRTNARKRARQAARAVLPNATETMIVMSGNFTAWRHFIDMRATEHADVEIRRLAIGVLRNLQRLAPNVFGDYAITACGDGTEVATSLLGATPG